MATFNRTSNVIATGFGRVLLSAVVAGSAILGAFALAGTGTQSASAQAAGDAHVRVLHASPDAPAVDVYVNGGKAFSDLAFGKVSEWASLPAGSYDVKVTAAGQTAAVISANLALESGKYYTVAAVGQVANISAKVFEDDLSALAAGKARLRVVHASPNAPPVDVAIKNGAVLVPNLAFPNASGYLTVDGMTVDLDVLAAGTKTVALPITGFTIEPGKVYSVYAIGLLGGTPALTVLPVADSAMTMAAGTGASMPKTGAGENLMLVALLALAALVLTGGIATRVAVRVRR